MLSFKEASSRVESALEGSKIINSVTLPTRFVFQVKLNLPHEEEFPVLISCDKESGKMKDISIFDDPDNEIIARELTRKAG